MCSQGGRGITVAGNSVGKVSSDSWWCGERELVRLINVNCLWKVKFIGGHFSTGSDKEPILKMF